MNMIFTCYFCDNLFCCSIPYDLCRYTNDPHQPPMPRHGYCGPRINTRDSTVTVKAHVVTTSTQLTYTDN